jgi:hypothetical protein
MKKYKHYETALLSQVLLWIAGVCTFSSFFTLMLSPILWTASLSTAIILFVVALEYDRAVFHKQLDEKNKL